MTDGAELAVSRRARFTARVGAARERIRAKPGGMVLWRIGVTIVGVVVVVVGIILLPLPGPGWLIIFTGLGVLATEYPWAGRLLRRLRAIVTRWARWATDRHVVLQALIAFAGLLLLVAAAAGGWYLADQM